MRRVVFIPCSTSSEVRPMRGGASCCGQMVADGSEKLKLPAHPSRHSILVIRYLACVWYLRAHRKGYSRIRLLEQVCSNASQMRTQHPAESTNVSGVLCFE